MARVRLIGDRRRGVQTALALLWFLPPWLFRGESRAFRLDPGAGVLEIAGLTLVLQDLWLLGLAGVIVVIAGLFVTALLGRVWCGWGCPHTLLCDATAALSRRRPLARHAAAALCALACALTAVWYLLPPDRFFSLLLAGELPRAAWHATLALTVLLYADLALVGRTLCREFCPYGRIQAALADRDTLTLVFPEDEADRCLRCGACVRACPTGIDIRCGNGIGCIDCGRCLDACRTAMARRGAAGIIRYRYGRNGEGWRAHLQARNVLLGGLLTALTATLALTLGRLPDYALEIGRTPGSVARRLDPDRYVNFYTLVLTNRRNAPLTAELRATADGAEIPLQGPGRVLSLAPHGHRRTTVAAILPAAAAGERTLHFSLVAADGAILSTAVATATPPQHGGRP